MKYFLSFCILFSSYTIFSQKIIYKRYYPNGVLSKKGRLIGGFHVRKWKYYNNDGTLNNLIKHKNGKKIYTKTYNKDGTLASITKYKKGLITYKKKYTRSGFTKEFYIEKEQLDSSVSYYKKRKVKSYRTEIIKKEYFENGNIKSIDSLKSRYYMDFYLDGQVFSVRNDSINKTYYENGNIRSIINYKNRPRSEKYFYPNGNILRIKNDTIEKEYFENGNIKSLKNKENGQLNGVTESYCHSGQLCNSAFYVDGKLHGESVGFYKENQLSYLKEYSHGCPINESKDYYYNGNLSQRIRYENCKVVRSENFYSNGKIKTLDQGLEMSEYDTNGVLISKKNYDKSFLTKYDVTESKNNTVAVLTGTYSLILYFDNSETKETSEYFESKLIGERKVFYKNGNIHKIEHWKDGNLDGEVIEYDLNGGLKQKLNFKNGKKQKRK